jgi:aspartate/methionine/tyrosine aminotransferase
MNFQPFDLELYQSLFEHNVDYNLADSSVKCVNISEFLKPDELARLANTSLMYPMVNGTLRLRERISALYKNAMPDNVLVTVGASEANNIVCQSLLRPGDEVIVMEPGYRQVWGIAKNLGCNVKTFQLRPENDWKADLAELESIITAKTKLIALVNPNNPTGTVLTLNERQHILNIADKVGAWLHVDEVYSGSEQDTDEETPSFWGNYDKLVCTNSLSKAYGLSGLRIGWAIAAKETIEDLWRRHEYAVIAAAAPSMFMAELALSEAKRSQLIERQRQLSRDGRALLETWLSSHADVVSVKPSAATSLGFVHYHFDKPSYEVAETIRQRASVLVAPGSSLGSEGHLRITLGYPTPYLQIALERIAPILYELKETRAPQRVS